MRTLGLVFIAGSLGCEGQKQDSPLDNAALNAGLDPQNHPIVALVAHFEAHGMKLVHERGGWWRVTQPANPDHDVIVSLRAFPEGASADQMQDALARGNLAYLLNARAHVAMSYPSMRDARPGATTEARFVALKATLERLLQEYRPPPAEPGAAISVPHSMGAQSMATQWKSVVYAYHSGATGAGSLRARTSDLIHLSAPRPVAVRAVFRYDPETDAWEHLALDPLPSIALPVPPPQQIHSAESDQVLLTIPLPVGLFWAVWEEDGHRLASAIMRVRCYART